MKTVPRIFAAGYRGRSASNYPLLLKKMAKYGTATLGSVLVVFLLFLTFEDAANSEEHAASLDYAPYLVTLGIPLASERDSWDFKK